VYNFYRKLNAKGIQYKYDSPVEKDMKIEPRKDPPKSYQGATESTKDAPRLFQVQKEPLLLYLFFVICFFNNGIVSTHFVSLIMIFSQKYHYLQA
jgi:hypothetical protein